jgi:hypothetical protein
MTVVYGGRGVFFVLFVDVTGFHGLFGAENCMSLRNVALTKLEKDSLFIVIVQEFDLLINVNTEI